MEVIEAVRSVIGNNPAELHKPYLPPKTIEYLQDCIASGNLSAGILTKRFEEMICDITGAKYAVAMCNATCALHVTLVCLGLTSGTIKIPSLTFVATANAVTHAGMRPHFVEPENAHLPVDIHGMNSPVDAILRDSAGELGTKGITGTRIYSFNQNKIVTCSLGGALVTNDEKLAKTVFHKITTARMNHLWLVEHDAIAYNYRISDINAAIGIAQLEQFDYILKAKRALADKYKKAFDKIGVEMIWDEDSNHWLNTILVDNRDEVLQGLHDAGYKARAMPTPLHLLKPYKNHPKDDLTKTVNIWKRAIQLPSSPELGFLYV
jgi:perosamine synthetase